MESDGDRLLTTFAPDRSVAIEWTAIGTGAFFVSLFGLGWLYGRAVAASTTAVDFSSLGVGAIATGVVGTILLLAGVVIVHELLHGAGIRYYGGDVSFGVGIGS